MTNNLSYDKLFLNVGPWWFFSMIIQLYFLFPFLFMAIKKYKGKGFFILLASSVLLIYSLFPLTEKANIPLFGNFLGHLPEFLLGIGIASFKNFKIDIKLFVFATLIFMLSCVSEYVFPLSFLSGTIFFLFLLYPVYNNTAGMIAKPLIFIGRISMIMFVTNGPMRFFIIPRFINESSNPLCITLVSFIHLLVVIIISYIIYLFYSRKIQPLNKSIIDKLTK